MTPRVKKILQWVGYPAFYLFALLLFAAWTFPYERIRDRIVAEYNATRDPDGYRLEIDEVDGYWLSGIEIEDARLVPPPAPKPTGDAGAPQRAEVSIAEAHARASIVRLLFGTLALGFGAEAFEGEIDGDFVDSSEGKELDVEIEDVNMAGLPYVDGVVGGLPLSGRMTGTIHLVLPEGKLENATGEIAFTVTELAVGDGKTKIEDVPLPALPQLRAGDLVLEAEAEEGRLSLTKLEAKGPDLEIVADGKIRLRDPFATSLAELNARFRFTEAYKKKNDVTKALFGEPGSKAGGLMDLDPKVKRAKRADGFYGWRLTGPLGKLDFQPSALSGVRGAAPSRRVRTPRK